MSGTLSVVDVLRSSAAADSIQGALESPRAGAELSGDVFEIVGWVAGVESAARSVEILAGSTVLARTTVGIERPDVVAAFPTLAGAAEAGFAARVATAGFAELELAVEVALDDGSRHRLAEIRVQRDPAPESPTDEDDLVAVIVFARQAEPLVETLESIVVQTYPAFDVTIVGATEDAALHEAAGRFPNVRFAPHPAGSRGEAWNGGVNGTRGAYVLFVAAGARLTPGALAAGVEALRQHPAWGLVTGGQNPGQLLRASLGDGGLGLLGLLRERTVGAGGTVLYRRRAIEAVGGFDERLLGEEHYDLALRIARRHPVGRHGEPALEDGSSEVPTVGGVAFGALRRVTPLGRDFGYGRGQPIDRHYIEEFLERHAADVSGDVLEVSEPAYTERFGGDRVRRSHVVSLTDDNPAATLIADLADAPQLQDGMFDCVILTQTLHLIYDIRSAVHTSWRTLRPGGVALVTVPGITQLDRVETWHWSLTPASAARLFGDRFGEGNVAVEGHGNVLAATAFLFGLAAEELTVDELDYYDADYPVTIAVRAVKANTAG